MNLHLHATGVHLAALLTSWQFVLGTVVLSLGPALAMRRHRAALAARDPQQHAAAVERRGRRIEDQLTLVVAAAAASLSATGLRRVGQHQMGLHDPFDLVPFIALDVATIVCGRRARRRARDGMGPGLSGALFWILAGTSAFFSAAQAASLLGALVRAVWPVLAAVLWEIGSLEERRKQARPDRRLALVRLLHPLESLRVTMLLAARQDLSEEHATAEVRVSRAAYRWYRLRRAQEAAKQAGTATRWAFRLREARADARAQRASERADCVDPAVLEQVVRRLQLRVRQSEWVGMNLRTPAAFHAVLATLIGTSPSVPADAAAPHTGTPSSHTAQVSPIPEAEQETERNGEGSGTEPLSDEEVMAAFVRHVPRNADGVFDWGINRIARRLRIGAGRATRLLDTQHEWLPAALAAAGLDPSAEPNVPGTRDAVGSGDGERSSDTEPAVENTAAPLQLPPPVLGQTPDFAGDDAYHVHAGSGLLVPVGADSR